jgi:hypothetical protein
MHVGFDSEDPRKSVESTLKLATDIKFHPVHQITDAGWVVVGEIAVVEVKVNVA